MACVIKYGLLFNWYAASDARNITSAGWHVPAVAEWLTLINYLGGYALAGAEMKETGFTYWDSPNTGATNSVKFNLRGSGWRYGPFGGFYAGKNIIGFTWSITEWDATNGRCLESYNNLILCQLASEHKRDGAGIRPMKDSTILNHGQTGTYTGNDGKVYRTICIGTQEWLADNLAETKYRDGSAIPEVTSDAAWAALSTGAMCAYDNDWSNAIVCGLTILEQHPNTIPEVVIGTQIWAAQNYDFGGVYPTSIESNVTDYGRLYTWTEALAINYPGWHLPSYLEFQTLLNYLGGGTVAGGKLKEAGTTHWLSPNLGADNSSGFSARGAGWGGSTGYYTWFWTSDSLEGGVYAFEVNYNSAAATVWNKPATDTCSVRLIKN